MTTDFGGYYDAADAVAVQSDGKVVVAGRCRRRSGGRRNCPGAATTLNGSLDGAFGGDGKVTTDGGSGHHLGYAVAASGGKILVAGWANNASSNNFALARFLDTGSLDAGFAANGIASGRFRRRR